jgi:hypothetical protein
MTLAQLNALSDGVRLADLPECGVSCDGSLAQSYAEI